MALERMEREIKVLAASFDGRAMRAKGAFSEYCKIS